MSLFRYILWFILAHFFWIVPHAYGITSNDVLQGSKSYSGIFSVHMMKKSGELYIQVKKFNQPFLWSQSMVKGHLSTTSFRHFEKSRYTRWVQFEKYSGQIVLRQMNSPYSMTLEKSSIFKKDQVPHIIWQAPALKGSGWFAKANQLFAPSKLHMPQRKQYHSSHLIHKISSHPKNINIEVLYQYKKQTPRQNHASKIKSDAIGEFVIRHTFSQVPPTGFQTHEYFPQSGFDPVLTQTYSSDLHQSMERHFQQKFRLYPKKKPTSITFYLHPNIPKKYRKSISEGVLWWLPAFKKSGFSNAIQVKILPNNVNPEDVRYNIIQWGYHSFMTHSMVDKIIDPRTGEIIHARISLNEHQFRTSYLLARTLTSSWKDQKAAKTSSIEFMMAKVGVEAAFLAGRSLGLSVNLAGSTHPKSSIMDFHFPKLEIEEGELDISNAFHQNINEWDSYSIQFGYTKMTIEERNDFFVKLWQQGLHFITAPDPLNPKMAHRYAYPYDIGKDPIKAFTHSNQIRHIALEGLSRDALLQGQHDGDLRRVIPQILMLNLYQIKAVIGLLGGVEYDYGDQNPAPWAWVDPNLQEAALDAVTKYLKPEEIAIDPKLIARIGMNTPDTTRYATPFIVPRNTKEVFNHKGYSEIYMRLIIHDFMDASRLNRIWQASWRDQEQLSLDTYLKKLFEATILGNEPSETYQAVWMRMNHVVIDGLLDAADHKLISPEVKSFLESQCQYLYEYLEPRANRATRTRSSHYQGIRNTLIKWLKANPQERRNIRLIPVRSQQKIPFMYDVNV